MAPQLSFVEHNGARIKAAGPLRTLSGDPAGGLWMVEADSPDVIDALVRADPFWPTGLRHSVRILSWSQGFAAGKRLLPRRQRASFQVASCEYRQIVMRRGAPTDDGGVRRRSIWGTPAPPAPRA